MSSNQLPIRVRDLEAWLPHRPPMVWVDDVVGVTAHDGECRVKINKDALYMGPDGIRQSSMIEWIAQSFGYIRAAQHVLGLIPMKAQPARVFLVAVKEAHYHVALNALELEEGLELVIQVGNVKEIAPIILFDGKVSTRGGLVLFEAKIRIYSK
jgi:hypothetical protein